MVRPMLHAAAFISAAESAGGEVIAEVEAAVTAKQVEDDAALAELKGKTDEVVAGRWESKPRRLRPSGRRP